MLASHEAGDTLGRREGLQRTRSPGWTQVSMRVCVRRTTLRTVLYAPIHRPLPPPLILTRSPWQWLRGPGGEGPGFSPFQPAGPESVLVSRLGSGSRVCSRMGGSRLKSRGAGLLPIGQGGAIGDPPPPLTGVIGQSCPTPHPAAARLQQESNCVWP